MGLWARRGRLHERSRFESTRTRVGARRSGIDSRDRQPTRPNAALDFRDCLRTAGLATAQRPPLGHGLSISVAPIAGERLARVAIPPKASWQAASCGTD